MNTLIQFQKTYKSNVDIYHNYSNNYDEIKTIILSNLNINLNEFKFDLIERNTEQGFKMKYHRDNYMLRKFNKQYIFIPFDKEKIPKYTLIWYLNDEFTGGSLEFLNKTIYKPSKDLFIFFDSNEIHRVNEQLSGIRHTKIYKYY